MASGPALNLEGLFEALFQPAESSFQPPLELRETTEAYILRAELPGLTREDIELEIEENLLTLKGTKKEVSDDSEGDVRHREQRFGKFERRIRLKEAVDSAQGKARFENGVLRVELPKLKGGDQRTRLEIETS